MASGDLTATFGAFTDESGAACGEAAFVSALNSVVSGTTLLLEYGGFNDTTCGAIPSCHDGCKWVGYDPVDTAPCTADACSGCSGPDYRCSEGDLCEFLLAAWEGTPPTCVQTTREICLRQRGFFIELIVTVNGDGTVDLTYTPVMNFQFTSCGASAPPLVGGGPALDFNDGVPVTVANVGPFATRKAYGEAIVQHARRTYVDNAADGFTGWSVAVV